MKNIILICFTCVLCSIITGCIEVTRGYKSQVSIRVEGESTSSYSANPKLSITADKEYSDLIKSNADVSSNKEVTSDVEAKAVTGESK